MKVVHLCLSNYFADNQLYQENQLVRTHVAEGHEVTVVASTSTHDAAGRRTYILPGDYLGTEGARIIRLPYRRLLPHAVMRKLRLHPQVRELLAELAPDVIMFHGPAGYELLTVARYVREHPGVVFHIDSHGDAANSAQNWLSRRILHGEYYRRILHRAMRVSGPLLCISLSVLEFAAEVYRVPRERLEFFPLGGEVPSPEEYAELRRETRQRLGLSDREIMIVQSGKLNQAKRLPDSLRALARVPDPRLRLFVTGVLQDDVADECQRLIDADSRVAFLGWQKSRQMTELLCAADLYLQPGSQSVTMQHSLCCGCPVILNDVPAHQPYIRDNGWLIRSKADIEQALIAAASADLPEMGRRSRQLAIEMLDYRRLAERVLSK